MLTTLFSQNYVSFDTLDKILEQKDLVVYKHIGNAATLGTRRSLALHDKRFHWALLFSQTMELTKNSKLLLLGAAIPSTVGLLYLLVKFLFQDEEEENVSKKHTTSRQTIIEVPIPRKAVGSIIGRQGANIKQLQEDSGAKMNFKNDGKDDTDDDRILLIRGTSESAQRAEYMVRRALADLPVIVQDEVMVPGYCLGRIIGRGGENVRQMSRSSNTKIYVDRTQEHYRDKPRLITIQGTKEHIVIAKSLIQEKVDEEEEFRARTAVSAANRDLRQRSKESKYNYVTRPSYQVFSMTEDWDSTQAISNVSTDSKHQSLSYTEFPDNDHYVETYVSAIANPGIFWVQLVNTMALKLDQLSSEMTAYFQTGGQKLTIDKVQVGDIIAAPFENDNTWYRAKVMEIKGTELDLFYVDYGDSCYLDVSECKIGSIDIWSLPCQAIECRLAGVKPKGEWTESAFDNFERLTHCTKWKVIVAKAEKFTNNIPHLSLIDTNTEQDVNINEEMVRLGFAEHDTDTTDTSEQG